VIEESNIQKALGDERFSTRKNKDLWTDVTTATRAASSRTRDKSIIPLPIRWISKRKIDVFKTSIGNIMQDSFHISNGINVLIRHKKGRLGIKSEILVLERAKPLM